MAANSNSQKPLAAAIGFAGSMVAFALGGGGTGTAEFVLAIGLIASCIFGVLLVRELAGSLLPAKIRDYLRADSSEDK